MAAPLHQKIAEMAQGAATAHGLVLVKAFLSGQQGRSTLQVLLETPAGESPDVEACAQVSRLLAAQLDVADIIAGKYVLEVSSPGLDRPLNSAADCTRFVGKGAAFKFKQAQECNGKPLGAAKGVLKAVEGETITLIVENHTMAFPFSAVMNAELDPTHEEMQAFMGFKEKPKRGTPHPLKNASLKNKPTPKESA